MENDEDQNKATEEEEEEKGRNTRMTTKKYQEDGDKRWGRKNGIRKSRRRERRGKQE